jgi:hypothetical protein
MNEVSVHRAMFVSADSRFAECLCHVELLGPLTMVRARQLLQAHRDHPPDDCLVRWAVLAHLADAT